MLLDILVELPVQHCSHFRSRRYERSPFDCGGLHLFYWKSIRIQRANSKRRTLPRPQQNFRRNNLKLRGRSGFRPRLWGRIGSQPGVSAFVPKRIKVPRRLHINLAIVERRRAEAAAIERDVTKNLAGLFARLDDIERSGCAGFAALALAGGIIQHRDVNLAVREDRAGIALFDTDLQFPKHIAVVHIDAAKIAFLTDDIDFVADEDG